MQVFAGSIPLHSRVREFSNISVCGGLRELREEQESHSMSAEEGQAGTVSLN